MFIFLFILFFSYSFADCDNCDVCQNDKCIKCLNDYTLIGDQCYLGTSILDNCVDFHNDKFGCKECSNGFVPSIHGLCQKCEHVFGPDCIECDPTSSEKCSKCRDGSVLTREGACIYCNKYFRQCSECDGMKMRCTKCTSGKKPDHGFC
ncbi:High cysteine membrane protein group 2 [Entamoeba marina]